MTLFEFLLLFSFSLIPSYRVYILYELSGKYGELQIPKSSSLERGSVDTHSSWKSEDDRWLWQTAHCS